MSLDVRFLGLADLEELTCLRLGPTDTFLYLLEQMISAITTKALLTQYALNDAHLNQLECRMTTADTLPVKATLQAVTQIPTPRPC